MVADWTLIPKLPELKDEQSVQPWCTLLLHTLRTHNLEKYVKKSIPEDELSMDALQERAVVFLTIDRSISKWIRDCVIYEGFDYYNNDDTCLLFQAIQKLAPQVSETARAAELLEELMTVRRKNFASLQKFVNRIRYLKPNVQSLIDDLGDKAIIYAVLNGLKGTHMHGFLISKMQRGTLTWAGLIGILSGEAARERQARCV